jgi:methionine synthase II (cobalamin-independent)
MSRQKLESLGLKLPLFPTTSVRSFPNSDYLAKARAEFNKKKISERTFTAI